MDFIKQWTFTISVTLIIAVIFSVLSPKGNMGKYFKIILAMFIFVSFLYPLKGAHFDISMPMLDITEYEDMTQDAYENTISNFVKASLEKGGYASTVIDVSLSYNENEIDVNSLSIGILNEFNADEVKDYVFENTGFNAQVYYIGE